MGKKSQFELVNPLVLTLALIVLAASYKFIQPLLKWPVDDVRIVGALSQTSASDLQWVLAESLSKGFLFSDLDLVKEQLEFLPWVDQVRVRRVWPEQIEIKLIEKIPVANWLQNGLLDSNLTAFFPDSKFSYPDLPKLAGPAGSEERVWAFYQQSKQRFLQSSSLVVDVVSLAGHGAWSLHFKDGPWVLLGREQTDLRLSRLEQLIQHLEQWETVRLIDMRYPNGFSVERLQ